MERPDYIPAAYGRIKVVGSLAEVFNTPFESANCILFPRRVEGNFDGLARLLGDNAPEDNPGDLLKIVKEGEDDAVGRAAALILADRKNFTEMALAGDGAGVRAGKDFGSHLEIRSHLNPAFMDARAKKLAAGFGGFHHDYCSVPEFGRVLCCYTDPVTEWIENEDASRVGEDRYRARFNAAVHRFGAGDVFRIRAGQDYRTSVAGNAAPFIHRVPEIWPDGRNARLVMVG